MSLTEKMLRKPGYIIGLLSWMACSCGLLVGSGDHYLQDEARKDASQSVLGDANHVPPEPDHGLNTSDEGATFDAAPGPEPIVVVADSSDDAVDAAMADSSDDAVDVIVDATVADSFDDAVDALRRCASVCGLPGCGACPTNAMVKIHGDSIMADAYIDATEVTNAAYAEFLSVSYDPALQASECAWNMQFVPNLHWPATGKPDFPVGDVDWCDAKAYCSWANKHLCGRFGGAAIDLSDTTAEAGLYDEWYNACTGNKRGTDSQGNQLFSYGNGFDTTVCNTRDNPAGPRTTVAVGSTVACEGGYPGLFDIIGNVYEWTNECDAHTGTDDRCRNRGGAYTTYGTIVRCDHLKADARSYSLMSIGFRCCANP